MFGDVFGNTIVLVVNVESEQANGGAVVTIEKISVDQLADYTTQEYATLIMPQVDESGTFFANLVVMFPTRMRPDSALKLSADFFAGNGYSPTDLN